MPRTMRPLSRRLLSLPHHRSFHITPSHPSSSSPTQTDLLTHLKEIDTVALTTTQRQIASVAATSTSLSNLTAHISHTASTVQLSPSIPPYTPRPWAHHARTLPAKFVLLSTRIETLRLNLQDLLAVPYRSETGETASQKFASHIAQATEEDKRTEYQNLKFQEEAVAHRLKTAVEWLEGMVGAWREENENNNNNNTNNNGDTTTAAAVAGGAGNGVGGVVARRSGRIGIGRIGGGGRGGRGGAATRMFKPTFHKVAAGSVMEVDVEKTKKEEEREKKKKQKRNNDKTSLSKTEKRSTDGWGEGVTDVAEEVDVTMKSPSTITTHGIEKRASIRTHGTRSWQVVAAKGAKEGIPATVKHEANDKGHGEEAEPKAPAAPRKPKDLFALQAAIDKSIKP